MSRAGKKAIDNSLWGAFEGDTEAGTEDFQSTGEGAAKKKGGTIVKVNNQQNPFAANNQKVTFIMITVEYFQFVAKVTYHFQKRDLIQLSFHRLLLSTLLSRAGKKAIDNSPWGAFEGDFEEGQAGQGD